MPRLEGRGFRDAMKARTESSVVTDQWLLAAYYKHVENKDIHPVATDSFLGRSKETYNAAWLTREIVQNFVDHNGESQGTLDGVEMSIEDRNTDPTLGKKTKRFTVTGNWAFKDPTGIMSPHSEKPEGVKTAGGNGIGLKQTALRFLRDFNVSRFSIVGENWEIDYGMKKAVDLNKQIKTHSAELAEDKFDIPEIKHDWLVADLKKVPNKGRVQYIIETDNEELISTLAEFNEVGVKKDNKYLRDPDVENEHGTIKWLPKGEDGRLYINGQVFNYRTKGQTSKDYWHGPQGVTVRLNDVDYEMSVDRPPVTEYNLESYAGKFIDAMGSEKIAEQIMKTEYIWSVPDKRNDEYYENRTGALVILREMVSWLSGYKSNGKETREQGKRRREIVQSLKNWFAGKRYVAGRLRDLSEEQEEEIADKGYKLCPEFFNHIGVPEVETILEKKKRDLGLIAEGGKPQLTRAESRQRAKGEGVDVAYADLDVQTIEQYVESIDGLIREYGGYLEEDAKPRCYKIIIPCQVGSDLAYHPLRKIKKGDEAQKLVHVARAIGAYGLSLKLAKNIYFVHDGSVVTLAATADAETDSVSLTVKVIPVEDMKERNKFFILIESPNSELSSKLKNMLSSDEQKKLLGVAVEEEEIDPVKKAEEEAYEVKRKKRESRKSAKNFLGRWAVRLGIAASLGGAVYGGKKIYDEFERSSQTYKKHSGRATGATGGRSQGGSSSGNGENTGSEASDISDVEKLAEKIRGNREKRLDSETMKEYTRWAQSGTDDFNKEATRRADYFGGGSSLDDILKRYNESEIEAAKGGEASKLNDLVAELSGGDDDAVQDFRIVSHPTHEEMAKLALLRTYIEFATGVKIENKLFVFTGKGAKGINIGGGSAIGLHEKLLQTSFGEAMNTFIHEVAHNNSMGHGLSFIHMLQALFGATIERMDDIADEMKAGGAGLTEEETIFLDIREKWESLD